MSPRKPRVAVVLALVATAAVLPLVPGHAAVPAVAGRGVATPSAPVTRAFTLVAEPGTLTIRRGHTVSVWTYNGSVPGPVIRVVQGALVRVTLVNHLPEATTIHWHGLIAPNRNDGVAGVTQDAVLPGHSYMYSFVARDPGTYWYHPHQNSAAQVDKGLYGALVVLPRQTTERPAIDRTLLLEDWPLAQPSAPGMGGMPGMNMGSGAAASGTPASVKPYVADPSMGAYHTFTVNGRAYPDTAPIQAPPGALVRLRLVNAGYLTHVLHLHGARYRLVATDGSAVHDPQWTGDLLPIGAGQRMDIEFRMPRGAWSLHVARCRRCWTWRTTGIPPVRPSPPAVASTGSSAWCCSAHR
jgi:FtsP/CotA-like multicopper oxidase with cupredoxin domain